MPDNQQGGDLALSYAGMGRNEEQKDKGESAATGGERVDPLAYSRSTLEAFKGTKDGEGGAASANHREGALSSRRWFDKGVTRFER